MAKATSGRAWQRMLSGRRLDLLDPFPLDVEIDDVAHGLARVARWNGQTTGAHAYSVAQHTLAVEEIFGAIAPDTGARGRLAALLHDAPEYVIGDLISPFKALLGNDYRAVEGRLLAAIHIRFGLPATLPEKLTTAIKRADRIAAHREAVALAGFSHAEALRYFGKPGNGGAAAKKADIAPWPAALAERRYLKRFRAVQKEAAGS